MSATPQQLYERRLERYVTLINGNDGLIAKLFVFKELVAQHRKLGDDLWKIEFLLYFFAKAMQTEVLLALARLLEDKRRSDTNLEKFLDFCIANSRHISWKNGLIPENILFEQKSTIASHRDIIASIKGRRDKVIAHLDRRYFDDPHLADDDYPIGEDALIRLAIDLIKIFRAHEIGLHPETWSFNLAEFYPIAVDNMVRHLKIGREQNFGVKFPV